MSQDEDMPTPEPLKAQSLGEFCAAIRQRQEITQSELAKLLGVARNTVARTELDMVERPYQHLRYLKQWMSAAEERHMLNLLRLIDIKHLNTP
jgi:transcriptional regulator with XRE-family HTH domain